jgi:hypothetical protein
MLRLINASIDASPHAYSDQAVVPSSTLKNLSTSLSATSSLQCVTSVADPDGGSSKVEGMQELSRSQERGKYQSQHLVGALT